MLCVGMCYCVQTLLVDQQRFMALRDEVRWLTLVTSVLIVTYNSVGASIAGLTDLKSTLTTQISVLTKNVSREYVLIAGTASCYCSSKSKSKVDNLYSGSKRNDQAIKIVAKPLLQYSPCSLDSCHGCHIRRSQGTNLYYLVNRGTLVRIKVSK